MHINYFHNDNAYIHSRWVCIFDLVNIHVSNPIVFIYKKTSNKNAHLNLISLFFTVS